MDFFDFKTLIKAWQKKKWFGFTKCDKTTGYIKAKTK